MYVNEALGGPQVDTIFEIGGQDSKFIALENGVVVDFAMNEACAAGTGSFLEEQAEKLGIRIQGEFADLALASRHPARLGERCTVFMERDVSDFLHRGAEKSDLCAGLAYSIALNYLNRVVRGRRIGEVIFFQGGTAYNDAVAAAFSQVLGKRIIVPPHNGVIGAIGMALIARQRRHTAREPGSRFRGYDLSRTRFTTREFVCKACSNYCDMKEITIEGQKTYWGDKCSDKFRRRARTERSPVIPDLLELRQKALLDGYGGPDHRGPRVGLPRTMFFYERFPFWRRYLEDVGFEVVISGPTDRKIAAHGLELTVAQPCYPIQLAHGHVQAVLEAGVDFVLVPNNLDEEASPFQPDLPAHFCPWNQTLPFVLRAAPGFQAHLEKILAPTVHFQLGPEQVKRELARSFAKLGVSRRQSDRAVEAAYAAQAAFRRRIQAAGREALTVLEENREPAVLLVGRPYNLYDRGVNCDIPLRLRHLYGVDVLPYDFLPVDQEDIRDFHDHMYWNSGRRILAAGRLAARHPNLHIIYITNFKCGPDSFLKYFMHGAAGAPFLTLQFDGHGNDAGYLTRCEAYLDSKGVLRCWERANRAGA
jgi:predicted nucleotide-binding protein (sugar kinase/HSP70/actin superfamily)